MAFGSGLDGQFGIAAESTYGAFVAPTKFLEVESESIALQVTSLESRPLTAGLFDRTGRHKEKITGAGGDVIVTFINKNMGLLMEAALGKVVSAQVASTTEYTQTATPDTVTGKRGKSYTVQVGRPQTDGTVIPFNFLGGKVVGWEFATALNDLLKMTTTWDFKTVENSSALATPSYPASAEPFSFLDGTLSIDGSSAATLSSVSVKGATPLKTDRISFGSVKREPLANDFWEVTGEFSGEFEDMDAYDAWVAGTEVANLVLTYTGSQIPSESTNFQLVITIPALKYTGSDPQLSGPDVLTQTKPFKALYNGTDPIISAVLHTTDTAI